MMVPHSLSESTIGFVASGALLILTSYSHWTVWQGMVFL